MSVIEAIARTAQSAMKDTGRAVRLCFVLLSAAAAAAVFLTLFQVLLPAVYGRP